MRGYDASKVRREQREVRCARLPSLLHTGRALLRKCESGGTHSSSTVRSFRMVVSMGSRAHLLLLPIASVGLVACDAEVRREPSRALSSFSRKSLELPWAKFIYRCNASGWVGLGLGLGGSAKDAPKHRRPTSYFSQQSQSFRGKTPPVTRADSGDHNRVRPRIHARR